MTVPAHTPGPLQIVEARKAQPNGQWPVYLADAKARKIACLWGKQEEKEGNARLYAAAPDMLAALTTLTDAYESMCSSWDEWCGMVDCYKCGSDARKIASARAVIAEATGAKT